MENIEWNSVKKVHPLKDGSYLAIFHRANSEENEIIVCKFRRDLRAWWIDGVGNVESGMGHNEVSYWHELPLM